MWSTSKITCGVFAPQCVPVKLSLFRTSNLILLCMAMPLGSLFFSCCPTSLVSQNSFFSIVQVNPWASPWERVGENTGCSNHFEWWVARKVCSIPKDWWHNIVCIRSRLRGFQWSLWVAWNSLGADTSSHPNKLIGPCFSYSPLVYGIPAVDYDGESEVIAMPKRWGNKGGENDVG